MARKSKFSEALSDAETKLQKAKSDLQTFQRKASDLTLRIPKLQAAVDSLRALEIGTPGKKPEPVAVPPKPNTSHVEVTPCGHAVGETCNICAPKHVMGTRGVLRGIAAPRESDVESGEVI